MLDQSTSDKLAQFIESHSRVLNGFIIAYRNHKHMQHITPDEARSYLYYTLCENRKISYLVDRPGELLEYCKRIIWTLFEPVNLTFRKAEGKLMKLNQVVLFDDITPSNTSKYDDDDIHTPAAFDAPDVTEMQFIEMSEHYSDIKQEFICSLAPWEQVIWEYRFEQRMHYKKIAQHFNTSPMQLRPIMTSIKRKLKKFLNGYALETPNLFTEIRIKPTKTKKKR